MAVNILRIKPLITFTTSAQTAASVVTNSWQSYGYCATIKFVMPAFLNLAATGQLQVLDPDGGVLWTSGNISQGGTLVVTGAQIPFIGGETVQVLLSAQPSGAATAISVPVTVAFYLVID